MTNIIILIIFAIVFIAGLISLVKWGIALFKKCCSATNSQPQNEVQDNSPSVSAANKQSTPVPSQRPATEGNTKQKHVTAKDTASAAPKTQKMPEEKIPDTIKNNADFAPLTERISLAYWAIGKKVFGMEDIIEQCMIALFSGGHVLCEGLPGLAKTTLAKAFAEVFSCDFKRCQFSPDLLPSDLLGDRIYNQTRNCFEFQKGPVFTQILLADEINRSPAKTQAALLEVMQESQVTMFGARHLIGSVKGLDNTKQGNRIFCTIATQNPVEQEGTYRLPEAQLDRFMFRLFFDWPSRENELAVLNCEGKTNQEIIPCFTASEIIAWRKKIAANVYVSERMKCLIVDTIRATRNTNEIAVGAGPRASQVLLRGAKVAAAFAGRSYVTLEDIQKLIFPVLNHRLIIKPEELFEHPDQTGKALLENIIQKISSNTHE